MVSKPPKRFTDEAAARAHLEKLQWPDGPVCPHCGTLDRASRIAGGRNGLMFCNACRKQFSVTVGTVFERSKVPLNTWLFATHLLCSSKKGISAHQLSRMLGVSYKTAWFMAHRIREAMNPSGRDAGPLGGPGKVVEADETYIGKKDGKRVKAGGYAHKRTVLSLVERGGKIRSFKLRSSAREDIGPAVRANVQRTSVLHTDGAQVYRGLFATAAHEAVDHSKEYVRQSDIPNLGGAQDWPTVHTNTAEGFFSVFKRGMVGTYQHCGEQHLQRYLAEFDFRMNHRVKLGYSDDMRTDKALEGIKGKRLTYRRTNQAEVN
ncbi:MAG: IS1595 family transposase [Alphaproteobacteria bacterium]|nr:IS1595 family transposase [Alphaproteobacteria bacterium]